MLWSRGQGPGARDQGYNGKASSKMQMEVLGYWEGLGTICFPKSVEADLHVGMTQ